MIRKSTLDNMLLKYKILYSSEKKVENKGTYYFIGLAGRVYLVVIV